MGPDRKDRRLFVNIFAAYGGAFLWVATFVTIMRLTGVLPGAVTSGLPPLSATFSILDATFPSIAAGIAASPMTMLFLAVFFAPVTEEVLFRMLPLSFAQSVGNPGFTRAMILGVCGIVFGMMHGQPINIFIQGVVGLCLGWLYVKNDESQLASYLSCVLVHAAYNFTIIMT